MLFIPGPVLGLVLLLAYLSVCGHVPAAIDWVGSSILQRFVGPSCLLHRGKSKQPVSRERWALEGRVQALTECYERRLGHLPAWLDELGLERIVPLLECRCL